MAYDVTISDFENFVWDLFAEVLGHSRIYFARTNFIKPETDFATIRISNMNPLEYAGYFFDNDGVTAQESYLNYEVSVDIRSFRGSATATCALMRHGLSMKELSDKHLALNNIGYLRSSTISDTSSILDGEQWEQRAAFTAIFHIVVKQSDAAGSDGAVETVETTETTELADGSTVVQTDTITFP
jgi:hypothetical protein